MMPLANPVRCFWSHAVGVQVGRLGGTRFVSLKQTDDSLATMTGAQMISCRAEVGFEQPDKRMRSQRPFIAAPSVMLLVL